MEQLIRIHPADNVAVAVSALKQGETVTAAGKNIMVRQDIPAGHKMAIVPIAAGEDVIKYGFPIGQATVAVQPGEWMHTHNVKSKLGDLLEYRYEPQKAPVWQPTEDHVHTFQGYERRDGRVGIRNEVWIIPTVGCVNAIAREIERRAQAFAGPHVDGIYAYSHPYGCSQLGDDLRYTQKFLAGLAHNPNAGGVLLLGLGCENNKMDAMRQLLTGVDEAGIKFLICQDAEDEVEEGVRLVKELAAHAAETKRTTQPLAKLCIGVKCGGSDGFSGLTANPLVGSVVNRVTAAGGTALLTEVPEMFGAETLLMNRCRNEAVFQKTVHLINGFKTYFQKHGEKINENPSPGNKAGGITTLEDKSLGCVQKGGIAPVEDVLLYGEPVKEKGLSLLQAPGNDLVSSNALAASGAQMVLFTTGRGTPFSCPVPTLKIASNSRLASFKADWIDFNAGRLLSGESMEALSEEFLQFILNVASGTCHTKSEALDKHELAIFKDGVTL